MEARRENVWENSLLWGRNESDDALICEEDSVVEIFTKGVGAPLDLQLDEEEVFALIFEKYVDTDTGGLH